MIFRNDVSAHIHIESIFRLIDLRSLSLVWQSSNLQTSKLRVPMLINTPKVQVIRGSTIRQ